MAHLDLIDPMGNHGNARQRQFGVRAGSEIFVGRPAAAGTDNERQHGGHLPEARRIHLHSVQTAKPFACRPAQQWFEGVVKRLILRLIVGQRRSFVGMLLEPTVDL